MILRWKRCWKWESTRWKYWSSRTRAMRLFSVFRWYSSRSSRNTKCPRKIGRRRWRTIHLRRKTYSADRSRNLTESTNGWLKEATVSWITRLSTWTWRLECTRKWIRIDSREHGRDLTWISINRNSVWSCGVRVVCGPIKLFPSMRFPWWTLRQRDVSKVDFLCAQDRYETNRFCEFDLVFQQRWISFSCSSIGTVSEVSCFKRLQDDGDVSVDSTKIEDVDDEYETTEVVVRISVWSLIFSSSLNANEAAYRLKKRAQSIRLARPVTISSLSNEKADAAQNQTFYTQFSFPLGSPICVTKTTKIELSRVSFTRKSHISVCWVRHFWPRVRFRWRWDDHWWWRVCVVVFRSYHSSSNQLKLWKPTTTTINRSSKYTGKSRRWWASGSIVITPTMESRLPAGQSKRKGREANVLQVSSEGELRHREILDYPPWNYRYLVIRLKAAEAERMFSERDSQYSSRWSGRTVSNHKRVSEFFGRWDWRDTVLSDCNLWSGRTTYRVRSWSQTVRHDFVLAKNGFGYESMSESNTIFSSQHHGCGASPWCTLQAARMCRASTAR